MHLDEANEKDECLEKMAYHFISPFNISFFSAATNPATLHINQMQ